MRVLPEVYFIWERAELVDLNLLHVIIVELESFEDHNEVVRESLQTGAFERSDFLIALFAVV